MDAGTPRPQRQERDFAQEAAVLFFKALAERSLLWFSVLATTGLTTYAVVVTEAPALRLAGVGGYAILVMLPILGKVWRKLT